MRAPIAAAARKFIEIQFMNIRARRRAFQVPEPRVPELENVAK